MISYKERLNRDWKKEQAELRERFSDNPHMRYKLIEFEYEMQFNKPFKSEVPTPSVDYSRLPF